VPDFLRTHLPTKPCGVTSICHLVAYQTRVGGDAQATLGTGGLTNSAGTTVHLALTSGDEPSRVDTRGDTTVLDDYALTTMSSLNVLNKINYVKKITKAIKITGKIKAIKLR